MGMGEDTEVGIVAGMRGVACPGGTIAEAFPVVGSLVRIIAVDSRPLRFTPLRLCSILHPRSNITAGTFQGETLSADSTSFIRVGPCPMEFPAARFPTAVSILGAISTRNITAF